MINNSTGNNNVGVGDNALASGNANVIVGASAGNNGSENIGIGFGSLGGNNADRNVAVGYNSISTTISNGDNTALGHQALRFVKGSSNIGIGSGAGQGSTLATSNDNIYIANSGTDESGAIRIGTSGTHSTCFIQGISGVALGAGSGVLIDVTGQLGTTISSKRFKSNIADIGEGSHDILNLRPVTFTYKSDDAQTKQYGLIAEEVNSVFPSLVVNDENGNPYSVQYHVLPVLLLNEMQRQENNIDVLQQQMIECLERIAKLENNAC